ncbi:MAG TPA: hypothetical protein VGP94_15625 [Tepidisphaeraceae bacterium]|nr:hypothetical protein [Tepidisphaeraceae bacterium]
MFFIEQTSRFLTMWAVSGTKGQMPSDVSSHTGESASSIPPELLFWMWLLVSAAIFLFECGPCSPILMAPSSISPAAELHRRLGEFVRADINPIPMKKTVPPAA